MLDLKKGEILYFLKDYYVPGTILDVLIQYSQPWQVVIISNLQGQP